jgi:hypothetical protein
MNITLRSILDPSVPSIQIIPLCRALDSHCDGDDPLFLDELAKRNSLSVDALFDMPVEELLALIKVNSFDKLFPSCFADGEALPRGADTLCLTCLEHGACKQWVQEIAEDVCADHPSWKLEAVTEFVAAHVLNGDYDRNTSIRQITNEYTMEA